MADQLGIYNGALLLCGERFLASLTEGREPRRLLDHVWSEGGIKACLEKGQWFFAMRTVQIDYDSSIEPGFGYSRGFQKPDDWVLTSSLCSDEYFKAPLLNYSDEAGYWYSDLDTMFVRYVSMDELYGMNLSKWPNEFLEYVKAYFASEIVFKLSASEGVEEKIFKALKDRLLTAKNGSMMVSPTAFPARGTWSLSRNRFPNRRDGGGPSGNLIG